mgnify:CR=1 FL=1
MDNILQKPLITIITVVLNDQDNIEKTILSVLKQDYKNIQYIVIDGDSKDGTNKIIKKYSDKINIFKSEKDEGIYDAFNKGLDLATGDLIGFVNSGDTLTTESLTILNKYYHNYPKADFFFGAVRKHWGTLYGYKKWKIYFTWGFYSSHSTGFFIKKEAAKLVGKYNLKYKYSSDYDYFYRMIVKNKLFGIGTKKNEVFGDFQRGGFSSKIKFFDHLVECTRIRLDNNQNRIIVLLTIIIKYLFNIKRL